MKTSLFQNTVLRRNKGGELFLVNYPEKGWGSFAIPIPDEAYLLQHYNVKLGEWTADEFSDCCPVLMVKTYTVTYDDGKRRFTGEFQVPDRLPQAGDVYEFTETVRTLANQAYNVGDRVEIVERTMDKPHYRLSSLGNLRVKCPYFTSVWTELDNAIAEGRLRLVSEVSAPEG
jgi:hypothetical protein